MSITDSANLVRQQLGTARSLAEQSGAAFAKVQDDTGVARDHACNISDDVYDAGGDDESTNSASMGAAAMKDLGSVAAQHGMASTDLAAVKNLELQLSQALRAAMSAARVLPLGDVDIWYVINPLDSAQSESNAAADSSREVALALGQAENAIGYAKSSAMAVSRDGEGTDVSFEGGRLYSSISKLKNSLQDAWQSAGHGQDHQGQVVYRIDRALAALDNLERDHQGQPSAPGGEPVTTPSPPLTAPAWSQPVPPSLPVIPLVVQQSESDGFFTRPWQG